MKHHLSTGLRLAVAATALLALAACERDTRDLERWVATTLQRPGGEIEPIPPMRLPEPAIYDAFDLRDPFQRRVAGVEEEVAAAEEDQQVSGVRPDMDRPRELLESFPLDALRMVGTLELEGTMFALIRDLENVVHRVAAGDFMGTNHGRVVRVRADRVELVELFQDPRGGWSERRTQVAMADG